MNEHTGHEDMIARYLDGALSPEARLEFEHLMRNDSALAREVRAEGAIRNAFRNDLLSVPSSAAEPSAAITAKLQAALPAGAEGVAGIAGGASLSIPGAIFGTTLGVTILSVVGVAGLVLGILLASSLFDRSDSPAGTGALLPASVLPADTPGVSSAGGAHSPLPVSPDLSGTDTGPGTGAAAGRKDSRAAAPGTQERNGKDVSPKPAAPADGGTNARPTAEGAKAEQTEEMLRYLRKETASEIPRVVRKDSVKLKVKVE